MQGGEPLLSKEGGHRPAQQQQASHHRGARRAGKAAHKEPAACAAPPPAMAAAAPARSWAEQSGCSMLARTAGRGGGREKGWRVGGGAVGLRRPRSEHPHLCRAPPAAVRRRSAASAIHCRFSTSCRATARSRRQHVLLPRRRVEDQRAGHQDEGPRRRRPPERALPAGILRRRRGEDGEEGAREGLGFRHPCRPTGSDAGATLANLTRVCQYVSLLN